MHPALRRIRRGVAARPGRVLGAAAVALAAAAALLLLGPFAAPAPSAAAAPAESVPANVTYVGHVDAETARSSDGTRNVTDRLVRFQSAVAFYDGPPFRRSYLFRESNLSASDVASVTYFGRANSSYRARVVRADWALADLVATVEADANATLAAGTYRDRQLYAGDEMAVAAVANGTFAVGSETAVRDAVDVAAGGADAVSGPLRQRFDERGGYLRFAYRFRPSTVPDYRFVGSSIERVALVATGYRANGSNVTTEAVVVTADESSADGVRGLLAFARTIYRTQTENASLERELERLAFGVEGRTVTVRYDGSPASYRALLRGLYRRPEPP